MVRKTWEDKWEYENPTYFVGDPLSTVSCNTQIRVNGDANCHSFGDKHLFYVLFVQTTSIKFSGGSAFLYSNVGLVPVKLPGTHTLHSLVPA